MSEATSIDELLMAEMAKVNHRAPDPVRDEIMTASENDDVPEVTSPVPQVREESNSVETVPHETKTEQSAEEDDSDDGSDEYGNEIKKEPERLYTKAERDEFANALVRERLARQERNHPPARQEAPTAQQDGDDWQAQLETFVENSLHKFQDKQTQKYYQEQEQRKEAEFRAKFETGMSKFSDFHQVVNPENFSDAMTLATRSMNNPAAFVYAASKKAPEELRRISQIMDPTTQMVEIGRLEERLKKIPGVTSSPKPMSKTKGDIEIPVAAKKQAQSETSIDDLIAQDTKRRLALQNSRRR